MFKKFAISCAAFFSFISFASAQELSAETTQEVAKQELNGLEYSFQVSATELSHTIMLCIKAPCPDGNAVLTTAVVIKNISDSAKTLTFPSSNLVTIEVRDMQNQVMASTEADAMYTTAIEEMTLQPGESKVVSQSLKLVNAAAEKLVGDFTAVALVKSYENAPELSASIKVNDVNL